MREYLGFTDEDLMQSPYANFYEPTLGPLQPQVVEALAVGGQAEVLFPPVSEAAAMQDASYWPVETGFTRASDKAMRVFCLTHMPGVSPLMWDWWFGWHGCEAQRYKLWHPRAHINARWADGGAEERYIGRTSLITEYLGPKLAKGAISFLPPSAMGFDEAVLAARGEVVICARIGVPGTPVKGGWLLHQIRPVEGGSEMRSRMWLGGDNAALGERPGGVARVAMQLMRPLVGRLLPDPRDLLVHNAQEMAHLASFLPELYAAFGPQSDGAES